MPEPVLDREPIAGTPPPARPISRRNMLLILGIGINAVAAALFSIPVVGYIFAPARRKQMRADLAWVTLGQLAQFPQGETRLATYRNPLVRPSDGETANIACWVRHVSADKWQVFAISRASSCVRVMAAPTTPMARALPAHRLAACFSTTTKSRTDSFLSKRARFQPSLRRRASRASKKTGGVHACD